MNMAKDIYHYTVKTALEKDGWIITNDPLFLPKDYAGSKLEIDLAAERVLLLKKALKK